MVHAHAALPRFQLDAKRIAATSGVIALHVGVLMMLMMPMQTAQTVPSDPTDMVVVPDIKIKPIEKPVVKDPPKQVEIKQAVQVPVKIPEQLVEPPVDSTTGSMDTPLVEDIGPPNTFEATAEPSEFAQLVARISPPPVYPPAAIQRHLTGTVTLRIRVDASGNPVEVLVQSSSGHEVLDQAAIKVVKSRWRFLPAMQNGAPIESWALLPMEFVLD